MNRLKMALGAATLAAVTLTAPITASAFCGFYVSGGDSELFNDATQVVLMREGTKTVLSMQNNYQGPVKDFAMVVPVPEVLMEANVKTLPVELFTKVDQLTAPRLVEYWEQDPCAYGDGWNNDFFGAPTADNAAGGGGGGRNEDEPEVVVEAQFTVGEYEIVILSATEATALETWLTDNSYNIPEGAEDIFAQYIQQGMYFFVAKVDPGKVTFDADGRAVLSPLRFDYDSPEFTLPVRLGMVNSNGEQDLITYILGRDQRYEVANYPNATIPTNIEVSKSVRGDFGTFYTKLFDRTLEQNPNAVVTEYSWDASTCDPCPGPMLYSEDFATLGADVIDGQGNDEGWGWRNGWVITRLHARYSKDGLTDDLVFRKADPIVGGREVYDANRIETGATPASFNNFQGRYIMRNRWTGGVACADPQWGVWGGPPADSEQQDTGPIGALSANSVAAVGGGEPANDISEVPLERLVREDVDELELVAERAPSATLGCSSSDANNAAAPLSALSLLGLLGLARRRRRAT
jgi:MYXO-CTERM domain-containing protein